MANKIARWVFGLAGIYGTLLALGMFLHPPAMLGKAPQQQPEMYYGFATLCLAWQIVFFVIASDPAKYRLLMFVAAVFEKFAFVIVLVVLLLQHRAGLHWIPSAVVDGFLGCAFLVSYFITSPAEPAHP